MALELLETNIVLDVYDHDGTRPSIKSIALDDNTRYVFSRLTYQGATYDIGSDATVELIIIRPDKVGAQVTGEAKEIQIGQEDESVITVYGAYAELDQPAIAVAGTLLGQFIITSGDQILRSQIFAVNNGQALDADEWAGQYDGYNLDELVERVDNAVARVGDMEADVSKLKSGLSENLEKAKAYADGLIYGAEATNLYDSALATEGIVLNYSGNTTAKDNKFTSDYIPVSTGQVLTYTGSRATMWIAGYDADKVFVANSWQTTENTYTVPSGVKYVRFSDYLEYKTTAALSTEATEGIYPEIEKNANDIAALTTKAENAENTVTDIASGYYGKSEMDVSQYVDARMYRIRNGVLNTVELAGYTAVILPCAPNDLYFVSSVVAQSDQLYLAIFCDADMGVVGTYKQGNNSTRTTYTEEPVHIPSGTAFAVFTSYGVTAKVYTTDYANVIYKTELGNFAPTLNAEYLSEFNGQERDTLLGAYAKLKSGNLKWTVLGDSITDTWDGHAQAGGGASDAAHGYAKIVARWLSTKYGSGLTFVNNGTGGITSQGSIKKVAEYLEGQGYDLIVVALGTNDWNLQTALATFETNYNALLTEIKTKCPTAEIAMVGLGYFADWKPAKTIREDKYNEVLYSIAKTQNIRFVAPYWEMKNAVLNGGYAFEDITYTSDPVHPNDIGHRIWADTVYKLFDIL